MSSITSVDGIILWLILTYTLVDGIILWFSQLYYALCTNSIVFVCIHGLSKVTINSGRFLLSKIREYHMHELILIFSVD